MAHQTVIVLDFGGQYNQLIARRVRECNVYCEVKPYTTPLAELKAMNPIGIIFTGGPNSVYEEGSPKVDPEIFTWDVPVLGICYGCQLMAHTLGGQVTPAQDDTAREYGKTETWYNTNSPIFKGLPEQGISWMSHGDYMAQVPQGFELVAHSANCPNVAIANEEKGFYGVQYHPEAAPGPTDAHYLFTAFMRLMDGDRDYLDIDIAKDRLAGWTFAEEPVA